MSALKERLDLAILDFLKLEDTVKIQWSVPKRREQGNLSTNFALVAAKKMGLKPRDLANDIIQGIDWKSLGIIKAEVAGPGFINCWIDTGHYHRVIAQIMEQKDAYGSSKAGEGRRYLVEFVSANPTGPLNVVSARAAAIGDSLVNVLNKAGYQADSEFYVNDAGRQIQRLGLSVIARVKGEEVPDQGYHGDYVIELAKQLFPDNQLPENPDPDAIGREAAQLNLKHHQDVLKDYGVVFKNWFRESSLHEAELPQKVLDKLRSLNAVFEKDGATWFKGSEFGDEDRVIVTQEGRPTYLLPDIAYHLNKAERGYDRAVDLLGPDHLDYVGRMKAALKSLGHDNFLEALIVQQVQLLAEGEKIKMSKRAGKLVTLEELIDEVGKDVARYFFLQRRTSSPLDFDLDLAREQSDRNPVFYVQYAHTRICGILRQAGCPDPYSANLELISQDEEIELVKHLELFSEVIIRAARTLEPQKIVGYLHDLATIFHKFYSAHRVVGVDEETSAARAALCEASRIVLAEGLRILGVSAPEKM